MLQLSKKRLHGLNGVIPNLERVGLRCITKEIPNHYGNTRAFPTATRVAYVPVGHEGDTYDIEDTIVLFDIGMATYSEKEPYYKTVFLENIRVNFHALQAADLFPYVNGLGSSGISYNQTEFMQAMDTIHHTANPPKKAFKDLTDTQKNVYLKRAYARINKNGAHFNKVNQKIVNELLQYLIDTGEVSLEGINYQDPVEVYQLSSKIRLLIGNNFGVAGESYPLSLDPLTKKLIIGNRSDRIRVVTNLKQITGLRPQYESQYFYTQNITELKAFWGLVAAPNDRDLFYQISKYVAFEGSIYSKSLFKLVKCPNCGGETVEHEIIEGIGCNHCLADEGKIHSYSTRAPSMLSFKATKIHPNKAFKPLYLGIELEYECDDDRKRNRDAKLTTLLLKDHAILKSDGSIRCGFEIVTCPATIDVHLKEFTKFFDKKDKLTSLKPQNNTGMHIHINREAIGGFAVGKMTEFMNNPMNKEFLEHIGGRKLNTYCTQDPSRRVTFELYNGSGAGSRYNILNLNNKATAEIRMFATPKTYQEFASRLEFADALSSYCIPANTSHSLKEFVKFENFVNYVSKYRKTYPNLFNVVKGL